MCFYACSECILCISVHVKVSHHRFYVFSAYRVCVVFSGSGGGRAMAWLKSDPASISTLRAAALLLRAIRVASASSGGSDGGSGGSGNGTPPCLSAEASLPVIVLLEPNLASESRLLRLSTMRVLARYDPLRFGEAGSRFGGGGRLASPHRSRAEEECNFLEVAEAVEALPISVATERDLMWRLGQLEVLGRSAGLPRPYARLMATHALGLLRVKFSGVWPRAAAIIGALCQRHDQRTLVWEPVFGALRKVMPPPATRQLAVALPSSVQARQKAADEAQMSPALGGGRGQTEGEDGEGGARSVARVDGGSGGSCGGDGDGGAAKIIRTEDALSPPAPRLLQGGPPSGLRVAVPPPQPWVPRLLSQAAALDGGPTAEMSLSVALQGVFLDEPVRTGLQPESGEVPLWASTDADSAFAQVTYMSTTALIELHKVNSSPRDRRWDKEL